MSADKSIHAKPKRRNVELEEERAWVSFYRRVGHDEVMATEVIDQLDADPFMKGQRLGLYLRCRQSIRAHKARHARNKRIGHFARWACRSLFIAPAQALSIGLKQAGDLLVACLPPTTSKEPAKRQMQTLKRKPEIAAAASGFEAIESAVVEKTKAPSGNSNGTAIGAARAAA
jgi:hypothetical protein